jgi:hypothetical protein
LSSKGIIEQFLRKARQRHLVNLALDSVAIAAAFGAAGAILLLLVGTQILDWYWPVLLFAAVLIVGALRARKRLMPEYRLAQVIDAGLNLQDRLSTVVFFRGAGPASAALDTVERQARELLHPEDVKRAIPFRMPRNAYVSIALLVAAAGLLGVRYGVLRTLDLSAPIAQIEFGVFHQPAKVEAASKKSAIQERFEEQLRQLGLNVEDLDAPSERALEPNEANVSAVPEPGGDQKTSGKREGQNPQPEPGEEAENGEKSDGDASDAASEAGAENQKGEKPPQKPPQDAKQGQPGSQDGMMEKMKNALANLLNKLKMPARSEQQQASLNPATSAGKEQQSEQGMPSRNKSSSEGQPNSAQQGDPNGQEGEKMAGNQGKSGDRDADKPGSEDSKSGMGKSDGDKSIKEAEQLAAMGKISEIFGKRAQQLTGEITVEVSSGKQHLKTAYTDRKAAHADTGAETARDEIPLIYQSYIKRYFEEVHKTAPKSATPPATATP